MIRLTDVLTEGMGPEEKLFAKHMRQQLKLHQKALDNHTIQMTKYWIADLKDFTVPQLLASGVPGKRMGIVQAALKSSGLDKKYNKYLKEAKELPQKKDPKNEARGNDAWEMRKELHDYAQSLVSDISEMDLPNFDSEYAPGEKRMAGFKKALASVRKAIDNAKKAVKSARY